MGHHRCPINFGCKLFFSQIENHFIFIWFFFSLFLVLVNRGKIPDIFLVRNHQITAEICTPAQWYCCFVLCSACSCLICSSPQLLSVISTLIQKTLGLQCFGFDNNFIFYERNCHFVEQSHIKKLCFECPSEMTNYSTQNTHHSASKPKIFNFHLTFNWLFNIITCCWEIFWEWYWQWRNKIYICNTNTFIFSACSYILCDGQEYYSFCSEKKLYSNTY